MRIMTPETSKLADSPKTQKLKDLENDTVLFLQVKQNHSVHMKSCKMAANSFLAVVNFKQLSKNKMSFISGVSQKQSGFLFALD